MFRRLVGRLGLGLHWHLARGGRVVLHLCTVGSGCVLDVKPPTLNLRWCVLCVREGFRGISVTKKNGDETFHFTAADVAR
jgi:hypothetical protein